MEILVIIIVFIAFVVLSRRIDELEKKISEKSEEGSGKLAVNQNESAVGLTEEDIVKQESVYNLSRQQDEEEGELELAEIEISKRLFQWLSQDWPLKVGAFLLILAVGWFVSYAFMHDWIGEVGRVVLGIIFGVALLAFGANYANRFRVQGNTMLVIGAIVILISIVTGSAIYDFFNPAIALVVTLVVVVFMTTTALKQENLALSVITLLLGGIIPLFIYSNASIGFIFLYLFIISFGALWVVVKTNWRQLTLLAIAMVAFYSWVHGALEGFSNDWQNLVFAFIFIALFYGANMAVIILTRKITKYDLVATGSIGALFLMWMIMIAPSAVLTFLILLGAILFAISSYLIFNITKLRQPVIVYAIVSFILLISATVLELNGYVFKTVCILEISAFILVSLYITAFKKESLATERLSVILYGVVILLSLESIINLFDYIHTRESLRAISTVSVWGDMSIIVLVGIIALIIMMVVLRLFSKDGILVGENLVLTRIYAAVAGLYATIFVWILLHIIISNQMVASMVALIIYTVVGVIFYVKGVRYQYKPYQVAGGIFFIIVLFRLFFVEFWTMDIIQKIATFFIVGALFISTAFIVKNEKIK